FYNQFGSVITALCQKSQFSIRAPVKIANSFYLKNETYKDVSYKSVNIETLEKEIWSKHASSYFAYKGYDRIFKLFESEDYIALEKKFNTMWSLDIANCFDSIYTHTISWAIKNKEFVKTNLNKGKQFSEELDKVIQRSNNNETNGIPIGAEFSRVFAELIFQSIDRNIIIKLKNVYGCTCKIHYEVLRYVDDYFIFAVNQDIAQHVYGVISDELAKYNLYLGDKKLSKIERPFLTSKSEMVIEAKKILKFFDEKIFADRSQNCNGDEVKSNVNYIYRPEKLIKSILDLIKSRCSESNDGYKNVAPYLISAFAKRIRRLVEIYKAEDDKESLSEFYEAIIIIMKIMFFFHNIKPSVSSSNRLATSIAIVQKFFIKESEIFLDKFKDMVMTELRNMRFSKNNVELREGFTSIEKMNVILATSDFGENYLMDEMQIKEALSNVNNYNYFFIISLLYYYKDHNVYEENRKTVECIIDEKFDASFDLEKDSELVHLFLDCMSCKYISLHFREKWYKKFLSKFSLQRQQDEIESDLSYLLTKYWFVKWEQNNMLNLLERKELRTAY
ncbi:RNA-directed DNA polymerase, partial [Escherichia coli]|nr:RNA-directed DNA polymerase [Escherichia coli]